MEAMAEVNQFNLWLSSMAEKGSQRHNDNIRLKNVNHVGTEPKLVGGNWLP